MHHAERYKLLTCNGLCAVGNSAGIIFIDAASTQVWIAHAHIQCKFHIFALFPSHAFQLLFWVSCDLLDTVPGAVSIKEFHVKRDVKEFNVYPIIIAVLIANGSSKERGINFKLHDFYNRTINTLLITSLHGGST